MLHLSRFNYNGFFILLAGMLHIHACACTRRTFSMFAKAGHSAVVGMDLVN